MVFIFSLAYLLKFKITTSNVIVGLCKLYIKRIHVVLIGEPVYKTGNELYQIFDLKIVIWILIGQRSLKLDKWAKLAFRFFLI